MWVRQLLTASSAGCNRLSRNRTHQTSVLLLNAINQQSCWNSITAGRSISSISHEQTQQASSVVSALGDHVQQQCSTANLALGDAAVTTANSSSSSSSFLSSLAGSSSEAGTSISQLFDAGTMGSFAAQPLEPLWQVMNPIVMSCSFWEVMHSTTGLPWWASIPLTTIALRTALLPLTLKAKSAGLNFVLAQQATQTADNLLEHWKQQQAQAQPADASGGSGSSTGLSRRVFGLGSGQELKRPSWLRLTRMYYRYYRKQHGTTSLWWWTANISIQLNVFLAMSVALRQMAATQWPGMTDQGFGLFTDLTHPVVVLGNTLSEAYLPYGPPGLLMPIALLGIYHNTAKQSPLAQRNVWISVLLDAFMLPYFWISCVNVPQATLLYWLSNSAFFMGLQKALAQPRIARALGLPEVMIPATQHDTAARERAELEALRAQQLVCGSEDVGFLRYLAASYVSRGMHQQALQCLQRLTMLSPGDADAFRALGNSAAEEQQWIQSARAFERAAELHAVAVDRQEHVECLMLAAKQWLNATAEARAMQKRASRQQLSTGSQPAEQQTMDSSRAAPAGSAAAVEGKPSGTSSSSSADDKTAQQPVRPGDQQAYINSALGLLQQAVHFQEDNAADAYYLLSMAQAADGKWEPSFEAANTFWTRSLALAENDQTARINAAAKLLPVLNNLCKQQFKQKNFSALVTIGQLAVEVAKCGWDRQTEEQLRDTLGAAAAAAKQLGKDILSEQIAELQQQLPCGVAVRPTRSFSSLGAR